MKRAVFFDRDGTLMEEVHYCNDPARVRAIPGAVDSLKRLQEAGWKTIIITNQSGMASGVITPEQYEAVSAELLRQLEHRIDGVYFCPDSSANPTDRRKPGTGMLVEAALDHALDLDGCWMVGDRPSDIECGRRAGCRTVLVHTGYGSRHVGCGADFEVADVNEAVAQVLALS